MAYVVALKQWVADRLAEKAALTHQHTLDETTDTAARLALTPAERTKLTNTSGVNTGDQDLSGLVTLATSQTITGAKTVTAPTLVATTPAPVFGPDLTPAAGLSAWTLAGGATWVSPNLTIPSGGSVSCTISVTAGSIYQIDLTKTASGGGDLTVSIGTATVTVPSFTTALTVVAAATGSLLLTVGGGTWTATVQTIVCRKATPASAALTAGTAQLRASGDNNAVGASAQYSLTTGGGNNAVGASAQRSLTTGGGNNAVGYTAQYSLTTGGGNNAVGASAQRSLTTGGGNNAVGASAQYSLTTGGGNNAVGSDAQRSLTTGGSNNAVGSSAQYSLTTGGGNNAVGASAQYSLTTGGGNNAVGASAQYSLTTGGSNNAVGYTAQYLPRGVAGWATTTASRQTSIGHESGQGSSAQSDDIVTVGYRAVADGAKAMSLGSQATAAHAGSVALGADVTTTATGQVAVGPRDIEIQDAAKGVVLRSPDGSRWRITVGNTGALTTTKIV